MISHKRTNKCTSQKYTCIYYKYTYSDNSRQQKQNTCIIFGYFGSFLLSSKIRLIVNVHFYYKMHIEKYSLQQSGVCLHFKVLKCFAVPVQQFHSTHTQQNSLRYTKITPTPFDPHLRTKPNYSLSKLSLKLTLRTTTK